jgi:phage-related protein
LIFTLTGILAQGARSICLSALTIAAEGGKADIAKPMHGLGSGVFEIALSFRGDAFRLVYAGQLGDEIWVFMHFRKNQRAASGLQDTSSI